MQTSLRNEVISRWKILSTLIVVFVSIANLSGQVKKGEVAVSDLQPGNSFDITGEWLYKPAYSVRQEEKPELMNEPKGFLPVGVPQFLNRVRWWLDDSADFQKHEDARLKKLGFDTERAEDGWYQLNIDLPAMPRGRQMFIEFEGVAMKCKGFCNGDLLGEHTGMFSRFSFDLTPHLKAGRNVFALFVSMEKIPPSTLSMGEAVTVNLTASKVRSLSKGMYGPLSPGFDNRAYDLHGIWQPVRLVVRGGAKLEDVWFAPSLTGAVVRVQAASTGSTNPAVLKAIWSDPATGKRFATVSSEEFQPGAIAERTLLLTNVQPKLWTPANPNLYRLDITLASDTGRILDRWSREVGFRTFEVRGNQLFLNGKPYWLRGADHLPYGKNPWDPELPRKLIRSLHDMNVRVTRTHATPWNEAWLNVSDEIGLGVSIEGIRPWALAGKIGATPTNLFEHWLRENEDVIKRCRNHPSVLIYTVGNEMLLGDTKNLQKWAQLSMVVKQTRQLDPTRPVIASSEYQRSAEFYNESLKPSGIDDGDLDDTHRYNNWYGPSSFVTNSSFSAEVKRNVWNRPLIGQEMSSGYPDLDTGLPVLRYTRDLLTPQAWVGEDAYPGHDPAVFLEHHRAVTKRWAERLRFERGNKTAGFMLFAAECWFAHSYDSTRVAPYPVCDAMREAWSPVGLALETARRRFYAGEEIETAVFVTNDDDEWRDHQNLKLEVEFEDAESGRVIGSSSIGEIASLRYYETVKSPVRFTVPQENENRKKLLLKVSLLENGRELSQTTEPIEVFQRPETPKEKIKRSVIARSIGPGMEHLVEGYFGSVSQDLSSSFDVILVGPDEPLTQLETGGNVRKMVEKGATAVLFSPGEDLLKVFPDYILEVRAGQAEFADQAPIIGTKLALLLHPTDTKWWARKNDWRMFIASQSHRLKAGGGARELLRYIPPHSYIPASKLPEQYRAVLFEIPLGRGRVWICDLDLEASVGTDPAAEIFARNLLMAAADPLSTKKLPRVPSHEELLKKSRR